MSAPVPPVPTTPAPGALLSPDAALALTEVADWRELAAQASTLRDAGWGSMVTYSRKVFVPLTQLCRDVCHYCTFAKTPRRLEKPYLLPDEVLEIARAGGARTILNPAPAADLPEGMLALCDYVTPNESEAEALTGVPVTTVESAEAAADALAHPGEIQNVHQSSLRCGIALRK